MKTIWTLILALCLMPAVSLAEGPTTAPSTLMVMFVPFQQADAQGVHAWIGEAVQEDMMTHVQAEGYRLQVAEKAVPDRAAALAQAQSQGANLVMTGTFVVKDEQVRLNTELDDVATGNVVGTMAANGTIRDLFAIEDSMDGQMSKVLRPLVAQMPVVVGPQTEQQAQPAYPYAEPAPSTVYAPSQPYYDQGYSYSPDYAYPYDYSSYPYYYDYGYPYYYGSPFVYIGGGFYGGYYHGGYYHGGPYYRGGYYNHVSGGFVGGGVHPGFSGGFHGAAGGGFHASPGAVGGGFHGGGGGGFHGGGGGRR